MKRRGPEEPNQDAGPLFQAQMRRSVGMARTVSRADNVDPLWRSQALSALHSFAMAHSEFPTEDARAAIGTPDGINPKVWGPLFKAAQKAGWIAPSGYVLANSSNRSPKTLWKSLIYTEIEP